MLPYLLLILLGSVVGALAGFVHPVAPAALVGGLWAVMIGLTRPFLMLAAFLVVLYTRPADFIPALIPLQLAKLTAAAAVGVTLGSKLLDRDFSWAKASPNAPLIVLTMAIFISAQLGTDPTYSMLGFKEGWVKILIVYFLIINLVDTPRRALSVQMVIAACVTFLGGYAVYAKLAGLADIEGSRAGAAGLVGDPNDLALSLLTGMPFLATATLEVKGWRRWMVGLMFLVTFLGFLATQSRGGLLGFAMAGYILLRERVKSRAVVAGVMGVALAGLVVVAGVTSRATVETMGNTGIDQSAHGRLVAWEAGLRMFRDNPLFGIGFYEFPSNYWTYATNVTEYWVQEKAAHNTFVKALAETGLAGFIPFCLMLFYTVRSAFAVRREATGPPSLERSMKRSQVATLFGVGTAAFFLSQTWLWFIYILVAHNAALERLYVREAVDEALGQTSADEVTPGASLSRLA